MVLAQGIVLSRPLALLLTEGLSDTCTVKLN